MTDSYLKSECVLWVGPGHAGPPALGLSTSMGFVAAELSTILLDAITDKDPLVQEQVCSALCALGESQPEETLSTCVEHLRQREKVWDQSSACPLGQDL